MTPIPAFLIGGGGVGALMRERDWSGSPLGPPSGWEPSLRMCVSLMLGSKFPMFVAWRPELGFLYNDAYAEILGDKHPNAMGARFQDIWSEIWYDLTPLITAALAGEALYRENLPLIMRRRGYDEETWFTFSYSPVRDEVGAVVGMFCACTETTLAVLARRHMVAERQRLATMFEQAPGFMAMLRGPEHRFEIANPAFIRLIGHREILGKTVVEALPEAAAQGYVELLDGVYRGRQTFNATGFKYAVQTEPGGPLDERFVDFVYQPILGSDGEVTGIFVEGSDVTDRIRTTAALQESENRFRTLADDAAVMMWITDAQGACTYLNRRWYEFTGQHEADALGFGWLDAVHPDDRERSGQAFVTANAERKPFRVEYRLRRADGVHRWAIDAGVPRFDGDGEFLGIIGSVIDIDERREAERAVQDSEERLRLAVEAAEIGLWDYDVSTGALFWPARVKAMFGISAEIPVSMADFYAGLHPDDGQHTGASFAAALDPEIRAVYDVEYRTIGKEDGLVRWVAAKGRGVFTPEGTCVRVIGTAIDITARKAIEARLRELNDTLEQRVLEEVAERGKAEEQLRQAQKMEAVGQLTGGLAHDFNNLLAGISGSLELMQTRIAQGRMGDIERYLAAAQGASRRAAALTHRLLAFSRRQTLDPKPTNVNRLVAGLEEMIRRTVGPSIEIEVVGASGLWTTLVDPPQLENALLNLCINARDAMPDGGRITVETANKWLDERAAREHDMPPGQYLTLCVTDTGTGMSPEVITRVFDPFFTTKPIGQGTGLGLSMIYGFVRQSGGQVRIYSEVGQGTTVCLYLPRHYGEADEPDVASTSDVSPRADAGRTVLIVDDEPTVRMLVTEVLEELGYVAIEAADSVAGLKVLQSDTRLDLLVTDVGLPGGMNGRQMAEAGRVTRPDLKILFITGYAENAVVGNGHLEPGMQVMTKPFNMDALASRISEMIGNG